MAEPDQPGVGWRRYSARPFPAYRFVPGNTLHPRRHAGGHSFGQPELRLLQVVPDRWEESDEYLYAVDLYNFAYWWESHELWEGLWRAAGRDTVPGNFFKGLIQLAAANLKCALGHSTARTTLLRAGMVRLAGLPSLYMGLDVAAYLALLDRCLEQPLEPAPRLTLRTGLRAREGQPQFPRGGFDDRPKMP